MRSKFVSLVVTLIFLFNIAVAGEFTEPKLTQHRSMHRIIMKSQDERAGCTAYALSKHALLTAQHCDLDRADLYIDDIRMPFEVSMKIYDGHDHMILVVPGITFKYTERFDFDRYSPPSQGERVYMWGNPSMFPDHYREGFATGTVMMPDDDLVPGSPVYLFAMPVIGGDSGSSIFSEEDGRLVGIVTYGFDNGKFAGGYALAFTPEQIKMIESK